MLKTHKQTNAPEWSVHFIIWRWSSNGKDVILGSKTVRSLRVSPQSDIYPVCPANHSDTGGHL